MLQPTLPPAGAWKPSVPRPVRNGPEASACRVSPKLFASGPRAPEVFASVKPCQPSEEDDDCDIWTRPSKEEEPKEKIPEIQESDLQIHEAVGEGVTAEVFRGMMDVRGVNREVAIKKMFARRMDVKEQVRFSREISVLSRLVHPNLTELYGVSFSPLIIVTEFCAGGTAFELLHNCVDEIDLSWMQRHAMAFGVASAIQYLHGKSPPIIHRDLKSLNVLLSRPVESSDDKPEVKVTDFGLARMQDEAAGGAWGKMTKNVGTMHWMAPEVLTRTDYNETADVYSFAIFCYEVACRDIPFVDLDPATISKLITRGGRPSLDEVPEDCPRAMVDLMVACWAHEPASRPSFTKVVRLLKEMA